MTNHIKAVSQSWHMSAILVGSYWWLHFRCPVQTL